MGNTWSVVMRMEVQIHERLGQLLAVLIDGLHTPLGMLTSGRASCNCWSSTRRWVMTTTQSKSFWSCWSCKLAVGG